MGPIDAIGNPVSKGDLVIVQQGDTTFYALIQDIKEPSVISTGKDKMDMVGIVTAMALPMSLPYTAQNLRLANVTKVVKPASFNKEPS